MIQKNFEDVGKDDIDSLITNSVCEIKTLEYKQELTGKKDVDKKEFLADVSSFANASGGDILFGVKAEVDQNGKKTGAAERISPIEGVTSDETKLRLEEMIRNGIAPRLPVQIKEISGWNENGNGYVILIRIPNSFASPHVVSYKGSSRFYSRHSAGKYQLDVQELRSAFLATDSQADRIKQFRQDRLAKIIADETPAVLTTPHRLVLHMVPIASFLNNSRINLSGMSTLKSSFPPIGAYGCFCRYNLDGFLTHSTSREDGIENRTYCQLFFDGSIEAVDSDLLRGKNGAKVSNGVGGIASIAYEKNLIESIKQYLESYKQLGIEAPIAISLAILQCKGSFLYVNPRRMSFEDDVNTIDRDVAILPDVVIDSLDVDVTNVMKPIFDAVWNACGYQQSFNYDTKGVWSPDR